MNSEVPQNPEPDFSSFFDDETTFNSVDWLESDKKANTESTNKQAPKVESDVPPDIWLDELDTEPTEPSETSQPTTILSDSESQLSPDKWLEESATNELPSPEDEEPTSVESTTTEKESELFADTWLDESETTNFSLATDEQTSTLQTEVTDLQQQKQILTAEIKSLEERKLQILTQQSKEIQNTLGRMVEEGMRELKERKNALQLEIDKLERRRERIRQEMRTNFAGVSQELAIRVQGFKEYLVGSLQDLAAAAEQLELARPETKIEPTKTPPVRQDLSSEVSQSQFGERGFAEQGRRIKSLLEQYRNRPDYYGPPWQLRRTFEPIHVERVQDWFFSQGGKGAIKSMGSRLQNILVASAIISVLHDLYGDRCRILILAESPERLGEWRRALQDCLGISRSDFGSNRGVGLFESPEALAQKAERLTEEKLLPLVIIDETEERVNLSLLRFPMWLAFAPEPQSISSGYIY